MNTQEINVRGLSLALNTMNDVIDAEREKNRAIRAQIGEGWMRNPEYLAQMTAFDALQSARALVLTQLNAAMLDLRAAELEGVEDGDAQYP